jgi:hypothetical protein
LGAGDGLPAAEWLPPWIALSWLVGIDVALSGLPKCPRSVLTSKLGPSLKRCVWVSNSARGRGA